MMTRCSKFSLQFDDVVSSQYRIVNLNLDNDLEKLRFATFEQPEHG
jgi:hypothetical protein